MPVTHHRRLQPSLLDRLTDDQPGRGEESYEQATLSDRQLRASVLRDLHWLLNSANNERRLRNYPEAARSVLNFGMPALTGVAVSSLKTERFRIEQAVLVIIKTFEPRIKNPRVTMAVSEQQGDVEGAESSIMLTIAGDLFGYPGSAIYLRTEVDVESGHVTIEELSAP